ncbi:hypothetical protein BT96DRAFT_944956 [Gymnopus androsaceus JB14]|uniref:Uncharacterized protein n=1 Tax=Gymnopus androsaceus JB14 TaxID=1447944 RepID=A0A6A4H3U4_9AGAR|nr:hypothetical protein BT96DRAFT_944956 [Gymnopus androsaceus JB14]
MILFWHTYLMVFADGNKLTRIGGKFGKLPCICGKIKHLRWSLQATRRIINTFPHPDLDTQMRLFLDPESEDGDNADEEADGEGAGEEADGDNADEEADGDDADEEADGDNADGEAGGDDGHGMVEREDVDMDAGREERDGEVRREDGGEEMEREDVEMEGEASVRDDDDKYRDDGGHDTDESEHDFPATILSYRYQGLPPAPIKDQPQKRSEGIYSYALQENKQTDAWSYLHPGGSFICSHQLAGSTDSHCDGSCTIAGFIGLIYIPILDGFASATPRRMLGRDELKSMLLDTATICCLLSIPGGLARQNEKIALNWKLHLDNGDKSCPRKAFQKGNQRHKSSRWTQSLSSDPMKLRLCVLLSEDYTPASELKGPQPYPVSQPQLTKLTKPPFYPETWWIFLLLVEYRPVLPVIRQSAGEGLDPSVLWDLIAPPSESLVLNYDEGTEGWLREGALITCHSFFGKYLKEAAVQGKFVFGFAKTLKKFSGLNFREFERDCTYLEYARAATALLSFLMRLPSSSQDIRKIWQHHLDEQLLSAFESLEKVIYDDSIELTTSKLGPLLHRLLASLVLSCDSIISQDITLVEYVLLLLSLQGEEVCSASQFTRYINQYCRVFSATSVSAVISGGWDEVYQSTLTGYAVGVALDGQSGTNPPLPLHSSSNSVSDSAKSESDSSKSDSDSSDSESDSSDSESDSSNSNSSSEDPSQQASRVDKNHAIDFSLSDFGKDYNFQLGELRTVWNDLVPASLHTEFLGLFEIHKLVDDPTSPHSLLKRNAAYLNTFVEKMSTQLWAPASKTSDLTLRSKSRKLLNKGKIWKWIADTDRFQELLVKAIFPTIGVTPRTFQITALSYDTVGKMLRCLKILGPHVILCNPIAKTDPNKQYECFFAMCTESAWYLLFFLGIIRPIVILLLESECIRNLAPVEELNQFVFVTVTKQTLVRGQTWRWNGTDVNRCLKLTSLKLDANALRHVNTGYIRHWFPALSQARDLLQNCIATSHSGKVSQAFYGLTKYTQGFSFNEHECYSQIRADSIVENGGHAVRRETINTVDVFTRNGLRAMLVARKFVLSKLGYDVNGAGEALEARERSKFLMVSKPFLRGPNTEIPEGNWVPTWQTLGDQGLVNVTAALAHGYLLEGAAVDSLQLNYSARFVAYAVYIISCALDEWKEGVFATVNWVGDPNRDSIVDEVEQAVPYFRKQNLEKWIEFRRQVDEYVLNGEEQKSLPSFSGRSMFNVGLFPAGRPDDSEAPARIVLEPVIDLDLMHSRQMIVEKGQQQAKEDGQAEIAAVQTEKARRKMERKAKKAQKKERKEKEGTVETQDAQGRRNEGGINKSAGKKPRPEPTKKRRKEGQADDGVEDEPSKKKQKIKKNGLDVKKLGDSSHASRI